MQKTQKELKSTMEQLILEYDPFQQDTFDEFLYVWGYNTIGFITKRDLNYVEIR